MNLSRRTRILLSVAAVFVALAAIAPVAFYQYAVREGWRRQYLNWEPHPHAPAFANMYLAETFQIAATRRWTPEHIDAMETILAEDPSTYSEELYPDGRSDRWWIDSVIGEPLLIMAERLHYGPPVDDVLRERIERILLDHLDHDDARLRIEGAANVVRAGLASRPEIHARLLVMQHSDPDDRVRRVIRIQLEHFAVEQDLERKGKIWRVQRR